MQTSKFNINNIQSILNKTLTIGVPYGELNLGDACPGHILNHYEADPKNETYQIFIAEASYIFYQGLNYLENLLNQPIDDCDFYDNIPGFMDQLLQVGTLIYPNTASDYLLDIINKARKTNPNTNWDEFVTCFNWDTVNESIRKTSNEINNF